MISLRFDCRDMFRSARVAFSFQRLWIQFLGLSWGYAAYWVCTYAALILGGRTFPDLWNQFGLLPIVGTPLPWYGVLVFALGLFCLLFAWLVASTAVSRATYMHLKGNTFYTWKEAFAFAMKKKGGSVLSTPIAIIVIAALLVIGGLLIGLLGRIPVVGPIGLSLFVVIWFVAALLLIFVLLALAVSLLLTPAILATTDDDAFEGIFQSFSLLHAQPWRILIYEILICLTAVAGFGIFAFFVKRAWSLMTTIFLWGMGEHYADLSYSASSLLQSWLKPAADGLRALGDWSGWLFFSRVFDAPQAAPVGAQIAYWIFAIFLMGICAFVVSYPLAVFNAGQTLLFIVLKKKKDDENLLERKDREENVEDEIQALESPKETVEKKPKPPVKTAPKPRSKPKAAKKPVKKKRA